MGKGLRHRIQIGELSDKIPVTEWNDADVPDFISKLGWGHIKDTSLDAVTTDVVEVSTGRFAQAEIAISPRKRLSVNELSALLVHELGHVAGLWHESEGVGSVMEVPYLPWQKMSVPSERDLLLCRALLWKGRFAPLSVSETD